VLLAVARDLPSFRGNHERGAFRGWLRAILYNRVRHAWRSRQHRPLAVGGSDFLKQLEELQDGASATSRLWDRAHDRQVMLRLLDQVEPQFTAQTWQAFRRQVLDGQPADTVAKALDMPLHSVYAAKSRVLKALRIIGQGLID
jgi:RNA polymerase sigma-70 factor (ECF subfamily)